MQSGRAADSLWLMANGYNVADTQPPTALQDVTGAFNIEVSDILGLRRSLRDAVERLLLEQEALLSAVLKKSTGQVADSKCDFPIVMTPPVEFNSKVPEDQHFDSLMTTEHKSTSISGPKTCETLGRNATHRSQKVPFNSGTDYHESFGDDASKTSNADTGFNTNFTCAGMRKSFKSQGLSRTSLNALREYHIGAKSCPKLSAILISILDSWVNLQEPERTGIFARIVCSKYFESLGMLVILLNAVFMIVTTNHTMLMASSHGVVRGDDTLLVIEFCFTLFYTFETGLRLCVHRLFFFCHADYIWFIIDLALVMLSVVDTVFQISARAEADGRSNLGLFRVLRIFKLARVVRMLRAMRFVKDLRVMVRSILGCICDLSLFWCMVLVILLLYVFALFFVESMAAFLIQLPDDLSEGFRDDVVMSFGSVEVCMLSLFQAVTGGEDWIRFYTIVSHGGTGTRFVFILYISFFVLAAWNIVTSAFVEKTRRIAELDIENLVQEKRQRELSDAQELLQLMELIRGSRHEEITLPEFVRLAENQSFLDFFHVRGMDFKDADTFFRMLASVFDTNGVELHTFVAGCLRMKGGATSIDLHALTFQTKSLLWKQFQHLATVHKRLESMEHNVASSLSHIENLILRCRVCESGEFSKSVIL
eukprot:TRINITY_DN30977_c0_g1_i1.p1 TRINITY_DN30977_c0_g1~~TRINITY_DN30977_c0_g1_i1.p1  ORF type:complete len:665 (+),score=79.57 TRINITY_DN30977_c0_g1_i1:44-1996(+)